MDTSDMATECGYGDYVSRMTSRFPYIGVMLLQYFLYLADVTELLYSVQQIVPSSNSMLSRPVLLTASTQHLFLI